MALLGRDTTVTGPFPAGGLLLETLSGTETLAAPYVYELGLLSQDPNIDPKAVLGEPMAVGIKLSTGDWRYFHGIVTSFAKSGNTQVHTRYAARLCPKLSLCDHTLDCRIFNESSQDAVRILTQVLAERDVTAVESGSIHDHPFRKREICAQYQESDLHFVQRLLEEEGIYYFFRHQQDGHIMVLADSVGAHETSPGYEHVLYTPKEREAAGAEEHFWSMTVRKALYPGQHTVVAGYDPTKKRPWQPKILSEFSGEPAPGRQFEHYDHPGGLCEPDEAGNEAMLRAQADHASKNVIEVEGNTLGLGVGHLVTLLPDHDGAGEVFPFWKPEGFAKQYLVVGATYSLTIDQYETGTAAGGDEPFKAKYMLLDSQTSFRPRRTTEKPRMGGVQTALVVGPADKEIWTDKLGRVRVQFDWDRLSKHDEKSTCWVRWAEIWAGPGWGGQHIPRIGQEVVVRFLDWDPDRPIVTGAVHNADSLPPYELPEHATQSGIKSRSSKGGTASNFNEIRFEDKKGAEELHVQAEKDMSTLVKNRQTLHVGRNRGIVVGRDEENLVKGNRTLTVKADEKTDGSPPVVVKDSVVIGGKHDKTVTGKVLQVYGGDHKRKVDGDQELVEEKNKNEHVKQTYKLTTDKKFQLVQDTTSMTFKNNNVMLNAGGEIVIMAGGATLSLERSGMTTFNSPVGINLVCGASSLSVTPAGVAIAAPNVIAAAGSGSKLAIGADTIAMSSRQVLIEADGVCKIRGKNKLRLQESDKDKARRTRKEGGAGEGDAAASAKAGKGKKVQKGADPNSDTLEIHVVDLNGKPQEGLAYQIKKPDGATENGKLDKDGRGKVKSTKPGVFTVTIPDLDGADWDGDGAQELSPEETRRESSRYRVEKNEPLPTLARTLGFARWQTIWNFVCNQALRARRGTPNVLDRGDEVSIPTKLPRVAYVAGGVAEFVVDGGEVDCLAIRVVSDRDEPLANVKCELVVGGAALPLMSDGSGIVRAPIVPACTRAKLFVWADDPSADEPSDAYLLAIGELPQVDTVEGVQARLANLGYFCGVADGVVGPRTRNALKAFQQRRGVEATGEIDDDTRQALEDAHGC